MAKSISKDWVDAYFDHGVDVANRRIFLVDEIDEDTVTDVVKGLYLMENQGEVKPIELFLSSCGGDIYEMFALYDIFKTIKCPIHTFAYGKCQSATPLLLAAGEKGNRWCAPHCFFMIHDSWGALPEMNTEQAEIQVRHAKHVREQWCRSLARHTDKDFRFWSTKTKKGTDTFFSADEALEWGVADKIWDQKEGE
jgi:ATP-dependent Clp protease protease subunit